MRGSPLSRFLPDSTAAAGRCRAPPNARNAHARSGRQDGSSPSEDAEPPMLIKSLPQPRQAASPPQPVPVEHSPLFILHSRQQGGDDEGCTPSSAYFPSVEEKRYAGNAIEWGLQRVDRSLDVAEHTPPAAAKLFWDVARGPVGETAAKGVSVAAHATVKAGSAALQVAAPAGRWALQKGFRAALGLVSGIHLPSADEKARKRGNPPPSEAEQPR